MFKKRILSITSISVLFLFLIGASQVSADINTAGEMGIEEAVAMALEHSRALEKTALSLETEYEELEDAQEEWNEAWVIYPDMEQYYVAFLNARYSYNSARTNEQIEKENIALDTRTGYYRVMQSMKTVEQKCKELELAQKENYIVKAKYQVGLTGWNELRQSATSLADAERSLSDAENDLDAAYRSFNQLVGLSDNSTPSLTEAPVFKAIEVENLKSAVTDIIKGSPDTYLTDENIKVLESIVDHTESTDRDELNLKLAEINRELTTTESINALISVYNSIVSLEKSYSIELDKLETAQMELNHTKLKNSVGLTSDTEVLNAELALLQQQNNLFSVVCQHQILKIEFEKPWI